MDSVSVPSAGVTSHRGVRVSSHRRHHPLTASRWHRTPAHEGSARAMPHTFVNYRPFIPMRVAIHHHQRWHQMMYTDQPAMIVHQQQQPQQPLPQICCIQPLNKIELFRLTPRIGCYSLFLLFFSFLNPYVSHIFQSRLFTPSFISHNHACAFTIYIPIIHLHCYLSLSFPPFIFLFVPLIE